MSYTKKTWASGDTVTSSALNNMETGIDNAANPFIVTLTPTETDFSGTMDKTCAEIFAAYQAGKRIVASVQGVTQTDLLVEASYYEVDVATISVYFMFEFDYFGNPYLVKFVTADGIYTSFLYQLTPMS